VYTLSEEECKLHTKILATQEGTKNNITETEKHKKKILCIGCIPILSKPINRILRAKFLVAEKQCGVCRTTP
jgi:hypothetical protein